MPQIFLPELEDVVKCLIGLWIGFEALFYFVIAADWYRQMDMLSPPPPLRMDPEQLILQVLADVDALPDYDMARFLQGWFLGAELTDVKRGNVEEFLAWAMYHQPSLAALAAPQQHALARMVGALERRMPAALVAGAQGLGSGWGEDNGGGGGGGGVRERPAGDSATTTTTTTTTTAAATTDGCGEEGGDLSSSAGAAAAPCPFRFPPGFNGAVRCARFTLEAATPHLLHRPLVVYAAIAAAKVVAHCALFQCGFVPYRCGPLHYWYRPCIGRPLGSPEPLPMVFFHGISPGLCAYMPLLRNLVRGRAALLVEMPHVGMGLGLRPPSRETTVKSLKHALARHGLSKTCVCGHSYGTFCAAWMVQLAPEHVGQLVLLDPMCLLLALPDVTTNFLYAHTAHTPPPQAPSRRHHHHHHHQTTSSTAARAPHPGHLDKGAAESVSPREPRTPPPPLHAAAAAAAAAAADDDDDDDDDDDVGGGGGGGPPCPVSPRRPEARRSPPGERRVRAAAPVRTAAQRLSRLLAGSELGVNHTLRRHFWWANSVLFAHEMADVPTVVHLASHDGIAPSPQVRAYLEAHFGGARGRLHTTVLPKRMPRHGDYEEGEHLDAGSNRPPGANGANAPPGAPPPPPPPPPPPASPSEGATHSERGGAGAKTAASRAEVGTYASGGVSSRTVELVWSEGLSHGEVVLAPTRQRAIFRRMFLQECRIFAEQEAGLAKAAAADAAAVAAAAVAAAQAPQREAHAPRVSAAGPTAQAAGAQAHAASLALRSRLDDDEAVVRYCC